MQKVIIDVPNLGNPQNIVNGSLASALITKAYKNGIFIPENATNGDVIKVMFEGRDLSIITERLEHTYWWNAPYKTESEDQ